MSAQPLTLARLEALRAHYRNRAHPDDSSPLLLDALDDLIAARRALVEEKRAKDAYAAYMFDKDEEDAPHHKDEEDAPHHKTWKTLLYAEDDARKTREALAARFVAEEDAAR